MQAYKINIMGLSEVCWINAGIYSSGNETILFSGCWDNIPPLWYCPHPTQTGMLCTQRMDTSKQMSPDSMICHFLCHGYLYSMLCPTQWPRLCWERHLIPAALRCGILPWHLIDHGRLECRIREDWSGLSTSKVHMVMESKHNGQCLVQVCALKIWGSDLHFSNTSISTRSPGPVMITRLRHRFTILQ